MAKIEVDLDVEDLAYELSDQLTDTVWLKFMKEMDEQRADIGLTKRLHKHLGEVIEEESDAS
jgi:hypothetical protein